mmetsp:Transcript_589/g.2390  ORF Transcript_589/g.2390 Transcript_589/m.2390 type:complete len:201 (+) Transcript_589:382-984(+)
MPSRPLCPLRSRTLEGTMRPRSCLTWALSPSLSSPSLPATCLAMASRPPSSSRPTPAASCPSSSLALASSTSISGMQVGPPPPQPGQPLGPSPSSWRPPTFSLPRPRTRSSRSRAGPHLAALSYSERASTSPPWASAAWTRSSRRSSERPLPLACCPQPSPRRWVSTTSEECCSSGPPAAERRSSPARSARRCKRASPRW